MIRILSFFSVENEWKIGMVRMQILWSEIGRCPLKLQASQSKLKA